MAEAVLLALTKIGNVLADEAAKAMVAKLSEKVSNLRDLKDKVEQIRKQLTTMNNVIRKIGTTYLTDNVVKYWIEEVRMLAYRVEDVMDKYSYYSLQMEEERFLKKYFIKGSHYVLVFSQIADEVVVIERMFNNKHLQIPKLACLQMFNSMDLPWQLLEEITNGFSEERKIGSGGYGVVYRGVYKNGEEIAVKKLYHMPGLDDKQFQNELQNLAILRHQNIVRLVGKCYEERERCVEHEGKLVCAKMIDRVICLDYLHNGSLENHLSDESSGLPWHRRYGIIKGICDGLKYLHERGVFHLDLKPTNILLDKNMVPKIADFGLSRLFSGTRQSHTTSKLQGKFGYMPPEYIEKGKISNKFDVFSLGVIIVGIMTGPNGYSKHSDMSSQNIVGQVLENWRNRPQEQWKDESYFDVFCQLKICIEIALNCVETDRHKRPSIGDIICKLDESETMIDTSYKIQTTTKEQWLEASQLVHDPLTEMERQQSQYSFPELVSDEDLVGIEDNRKMLTEWLYSDELDSTLITVSGMGGLGKTTLVTNVYEREKINFAAHAWMVVSQNYTVDALLRKLGRKVGYMEQSPSSQNDLKEEIKRRLKDRKCLIVLDDVWNQEVYFQMCDAFQNFQASRIIITTRKNHVAALAPSTRHLDLQPLGDIHAFDLFCRRAFYSRKSHECPIELMNVATSIVDRCQGLPLAIVSIGSLLSSRPRSHYVWNQTYNQLRCELSNNDHVRAILNLSYHDLSGDLRNCFLYCSLFPEDYPILRETLVRLWVAEGFVLSKENNTPEEVAEGNLSELIQLNMLKVTENDELGRVSTCMMHDIVRDLAISVAKEEKFGSANNYGTMIQMDRDVRRLSSCGWKDSTTLKVKLPRLRTLVSLGAISSSPAMLSSILSESTYLTVVELQDSEITEVPASIGTLFNLRYIGLRRTKVKSLPDSVEKLSNLHTLDIKQTKIEKLPRGIVKIKKLRHLLADRYADEKQSEFRYFIGIQAPKELSNLEELQTLETVEASKDLAEQLKKLMQLRSVWIDNISTTDCANLFSTLSNMPRLSSLLLSAKDENEELCFETLKPRSTVLHKLIVRGQWAKGTLECPIFLGHGTHLKYLALSWCHIGEDPLGMLASHLPNLTYLRLNNMRSAKILVLSAGSFPHLKTLVLRHMPDVTQVKIMDGALPCIEGLYIVSLSEMDKVPRGIESLRSLKKLWLLGLPKDFRTEWDKNGMHQKTQHVPEVRV